MAKSKRVYAFSPQSAYPSTLGCALVQIAEDAKRLEQVNPPAAAMVWRDALNVLPPAKPHHGDADALCRAG